MEVKEQEQEMKKVEKRAAILEAKEKGATHVVFFFSGGGDSGAMDEKYLIDSNITDDNGDSIIDEDGNLLFAPNSPEFDKVKEGIGNISDDHWKILEENIEGCYDDHDWWNNDGGYGYLILNLTDFTYRVNYNIYYTESKEEVSSGKLEL